MILSIKYDITDLFPKTISLIKNKNLKLHNKIVMTVSESDNNVGAS